MFAATLRWRLVLVLAVFAGWAGDDSWRDVWPLAFTRFSRVHGTVSVDGNGSA